MKIETTREAAARRQPRLQPMPHALPKPVFRPQPEWAWPGLTRAELRDLVIEQIG